MLILCVTLLFVGLNFGMDVQRKEENYIPDYNVYHNLSTLGDAMQTLADSYPLYIKLNHSYTSRLGTSQLLLHITNFTNVQSREQQKVKVLFSYGEHSREFIPVESLIHFIKQLMTSGSGKLLTKVDLYIVGMLNPDGRQYIEQEKNYCWRGTSTGVDLNRNFDWHYGDKGSSSNKYDEEYRGKHVFSEPEGAVLVDLAKRIPFDAFVSFHSGIRHIYLPFADTMSKKTKRRPRNIAAMLDMAEVLSTSTKYSFSYGVAYDINQYTADGTIFDYMAGVMNVPFSFAIELWGEGDLPGLKCFDLFNPKSTDLQEVLEGLHPLYDRMLTLLVNWKKQHPEQRHRPHTTDMHRMASDTSLPSLTLGYILMFAVIILTVMMWLHGRVSLCHLLYQRRRVVNIRSLSSTFVLLSLL